MVTHSRCSNVTITSILKCQHGVKASPCRSESMQRQDGVNKQCAQLRAVWTSSSAWEDCLNCSADSSESCPTAFTSQKSCMHLSEQVGTYYVMQHKATLLSFVPTEILFLKMTWGVYPKERRLRNASRISMCIRETDMGWEGVQTLVISHSFAVSDCDLGISWNITSSDIVLSCAGNMHTIYWRPLTLL